MTAFYNRYFEFMGWMEMEDDPDAPDGAWWARMEDASRQFRKHFKLPKGDGRTDVLLYLDKDEFERRRKKSEAEDPQYIKKNGKWVQA